MNVVDPQSRKPPPDHAGRNDAGDGGDDLDKRYFEPSDHGPYEPRSRSRGERSSVLSGRRMGLGVILVVALMLGYGAYGHYARISQADAALERMKTAIPVVRVATAASAPNTIPVRLPGQTEAFDVASIYPRASGYITQRLVDIGSRVKKGDLLAFIDSPDVDQELSRARAQLVQTKAALVVAQAALNQAKANYDLATVTNGRYSKLVSEGWEPKQTGDTFRLQAEARLAEVKNAEAAVGVAQANLDAQQAAVQRYEADAQFERVVAPFDGVITARYVDIGDLMVVDSGNLVASGAALFKEAYDDVLRIRVDIPQSAAVGITDGLEAAITVPEMPGKVFKGKIARNATALTTRTRTLWTEVDYDNKNHDLRPGLYVNVSFQVPRVAPSVIIPAEALIFNNHNMSVATVVDGDKIKLRKVHVEKDYGKTVEIDEGLKPGDVIVLSPYTDIADGQTISIGQTEQVASEQ